MFDHASCVTLPGAWLAERSERSQHRFGPLYPVYADAVVPLRLVALRDTGETLTGAPYVALKQGPVLDQYKVDLIPSLVAAGLARQDDQGMEKPVVLLKPCESYHSMDDYLRSMAAAIARHIASKPAASISKFSHQNRRWIAAFEDGQGINIPSRRINMMLAMQQILDRDPWLDELADEDVLRVFTESRSPKSERGGWAPAPGGASRG